eukprot:12938305-Prorocentrum_lima.AAC.1
MLSARKADAEQQKTPRAPCLPPKCKQTRKSKMQTRVGDDGEVFEACGKAWIFSHSLRRAC